MIDEGELVWEIWEEEVVGLRGRGHEKENKLTMCDVDVHRVGTHDELSLRCLIELGRCKQLMTMSENRGKSKVSQYSSKSGNQSQNRIPAHRTPSTTDQRSVNRDNHK